MFCDLLHLTMQVFTRTEKKCCFSFCLSFCFLSSVKLVSQKYSLRSSFYLCLKPWTEQTFCQWTLFRTKNIGLGNINIFRVQRVSRFAGNDFLLIRWVAIPIFVVSTLFRFFSIRQSNFCDIIPPHRFFDHQHFDFFSPLHFSETKKFSSDSFFS